MAIGIQEIGPDKLHLYAEIPIAFDVESILDVGLVDGGLGGITMHQKQISPPYTKDYDKYGDGGPMKWAQRFDVRDWGIFLALDETCPVGGATVAFKSPGVQMLEGRNDLALLWDIRVQPGFRRRGIGTSLFDYAAEWSRKRGCTQVKIETQNVNVPACRFYAKVDCELGQVNRYGYAGHSEVGQEIMLIWYLNL